MSNYCKNIHFSFFFFSCGVANFLKIAWKMTWFSLCFMRFIQPFSSRQHSCQEQRQADTEYITWIFMNILWFLSSVCSTESPDFILKSFLSSAEATSRKTIKSIFIAFPVCQNKLILWFLKNREIISLQKEKKIIAKNSSKHFFDFHKNEDLK